MKEEITVFWFKRDLRLEDNEALLKATRSNNPLLLIYILEPSLYIDPHYSQRHWRFIKESIDDLNNKISKYNTKVTLIFSEAIDFFEALKNVYKVKEVFSTEETGIDRTYQRDILFSKFCYKNNITWNESRNNGVKRGMKSRKGWRQQWYGYMKKEILKIDFTKIQFIPLDQTRSLVPKFDISLR